MSKSNTCGLGLWSWSSPALIDTIRNQIHACNWLPFHQAQHSCSVAAFVRHVQRSRPCRAEKNQTSALPSQTARAPGLSSSDRLVRRRHAASVLWRADGVDSPPVSSSDWRNTFTTSMASLLPITNSSLSISLECFAFSGRSRPTNSHTSLARLDVWDVEVTGPAVVWWPSSCCESSSDVGSVRHVMCLRFCDNIGSA